MIRTACVALALVVAQAAAAQDDAGCRTAPVPQGDIELYLRAVRLQIGPDQGSASVAGDGDCRGVPAGHEGHPRAAHRAMQPGGERVFLPVPAAMGLAFNSAFPFGYNDGPVWAGKGLTGTASAGFRLRSGPITVQVAPRVSWSENRSFDLRPVSEPGASPFADPISPELIDLPQRFGDDAYARVDPGESFVRLAAGPFSAGASTASQRWGPAVYFPLILGTNAGGFPHLFAGTGSRGAGTPLGRLHGRVIWGWPGQSDQSPVAADSASRFATAAVITLAPARLPGLEVGVSRFFHVPLASRGVRARDWFKVFDPWAKGSLPAIDTADDQRSSLDNQLASVFARWQIPRAGTEVYGEYAREDHNYNLRDFVLEPDHASAFTLGLRTNVSVRPEVMWVAGAEVQNTIGSHLQEVRRQAPWYQHGGARQGHTHRGQVLGSPVAHGGGGGILSLTRYGTASTLEMRLLRVRVDTDWTYDQDGVVRAHDTDVQHALSLEGIHVMGAWELLWAAGAVLEQDRGFQGNETNLNLRLGARLTP